MPQDKLEIAFIVGTFPSIPEQGWFIDQTTGLIDAGVEIDFFSFRRGPADKISEKTKKYRLLDGVVYLDPPAQWSKRIILALPLFLKILFKKPAVLFRVFDFRKYGQGVFSLKYLFWAGRCLGKIEKYKVVHCHLGMMGNKFLVIKDILNLKSKIIVTFYGQDSSKYIQAKGIAAYDKLKKESSYILLMTEEMRERFIRLGFPPEKLSVHYTAVNPSYYNFTPRVYQKGDCFKMIFVGSFVEKKGLDDVFRAIRIVSDNYNNIELNVVGDTIVPAYRKKLDEVFNNLKINSFVKFWGFLKFEEILALYPKMHLMVQLSKTAQSGDTDDLPFVLLEGQMTGLPVVTTRHVGIPDGVAEGQSGFLVDEGDFETAAEKILFFINNPDKIGEFSYNANKFIREKFDIRDYNKRLINLYKSLL